MAISESSVTWPGLNIEFKFGLNIDKWLSLLKGLNSQKLPIESAKKAPYIVDKIIKHYKLSTEVVDRMKKADIMIATESAAE